MKDSCVHPDTGLEIPPYLRMSAFIPLNLPIVVNIVYTCLYSYHYIPSIYSISLKLDYVLMSNSIASLFHDTLYLLIYKSITILNQLYDISDIFLDWYDNYDFNSFYNLLAMV